jgi:hypothetical protein
LIKALADRLGGCFSIKPDLEAIRAIELQLKEADSDSAGRPALFDNSF